MSKDSQKLEPKDRITHLLEEARMVLPGTQALLGFQLIAVFNQGFERLPDYIKFFHLVSLIFIACSTIFLMSPAAFHRITERSKATEKFNKFGSRMIILALGALSIGLCVDLFIVSFIVSASYPISGIIAGGIFVLITLLWFSPKLYKRKI